jgi:hypothetical protein
MVPLIVLVCIELTKIRQENRWPADVGLGLLCAGFRFSDDGYEARSFPGAETLERIYSVGTLLCSQTLDTPANAFVPPPVPGMG